jgi:predicted DNA-binding ribbon-helix-helix protein
MSPSPYHPPVKRSLAIAGHKTSISLEPVFWDRLKAAALQEGIPVNALVARIDAERVEATYAEGVLKIVLPKAVRSSHVIPIHGAGSRA